jgi:DNA polymerase V
LTAGPASGKIRGMTRLIQFPSPVRVAVLGRAVSESGPGTPLYLDRISAGFPSPADDYIETTLDLNTYLIRNPPATFMVRVSGDSMTGAGIQDGDVLVVDRSEKPVHGRIVVAVLDGELTVKRLLMQDGQIQLAPENPRYQAITVAAEQDLHVWGVITGVVRRL